MWINEQVLRDAKIRPESNNEFILQIWGDVHTYDVLLTVGGSRQEKAKVLQRLLMNAGAWVTSHPPHESKPGSQTNRKRWEAMKYLAEQAGTEAGGVGIKTLTGPADPKSISDKNRSYWLELLDPYHRPGYDLADRFQEWMKNFRAIQNRTSFWDYLGVPAADIDRVAYLKDIEADKYKLVFVGNQLQYVLDPGAPFSTRIHKTVFSGEGWAIFVVDLEGNLYAGSHEEGKFHHSSFLSGRPVQAAGEMVVEDGIPKVVTCKSGHYQPTWAEMKTFVQLFPQISGNAIILPVLPARGEPAQYYWVSDFRTAGNPAALSRKALSREEVQRVIPTFAQRADAPAPPTRAAMDAARAPSPPSGYGPGYANNPYANVGTPYTNTDTPYANSSSPYANERLPYVNTARRYK